MVHATHGELPEPGFSMHSSYFEFLAFLMYSLSSLFGLPLPVAVPPLPDEPALTRVVPADALGFLCWNGTAAADPKSPNLTERLAAEPEVRAMIAQLRTAMIGATTRGDALVVTQVVTTVLHALTRPGCIFVRDGGNGARPLVEAGIVVKLEEAGQGAQNLLGELAKVLRGNLSGATRPHQDRTVDGVLFHSMGSDVDHAFLGWAEIDGWLALVLVLGNEIPEQLVAGLRKNAPGIDANAVYTQLLPDVQVARPSTKAFLDLKKLRATMLQYEVPEESLDNAMAVLGLAGALAVASQSGLEGTGFSQRVRLLAPAGNGLLGAIGTGPLNQDDLSHIPLDAQLALAARFDARKLEAALVQLPALLGGANAASYEREFVEAFPRHMGGLRWREDLLDHLGNQLTLWNAPSQGGLLFTGLTALLPLRDAAAFGASFGKLMEIVQENVPDKAKGRTNEGRLRRHAGFLEQFRHGDATVHWLDVLDDDLFVAPAWTVAGQHLVGSLMPQALRSTLDAMPPNPDQSLAKLPQLNKRGDATAMFYWHAKDLVALGYPLLLSAMKSNDSDWQREGFDFDVADLPQPRALLPHLGRELLLFGPAPGGYRLTRSGTLPLLDPLAMGLIVAFLSHYQNVL